MKSANSIESFFRKPKQKIRNVKSNLFYNFTYQFSAKFGKPRDINKLSNYWQSQNKSKRNKVGPPTK